MITRIIFNFSILFLSVTLLAGNLKIRTINSETTQALNNSLVSIKNIETSKIYRKKTISGSTEFTNLPSGNYLIKSEHNGFKRKTAKIYLDFKKKSLYAASFKLQPLLHEKQIPELRKIFPKTSDYYSTVLRAEKLKKNNRNQEELGILRSNIAFGLYEKSLSENDNQLFELAYQYAESGTELAPLSSYTWEVLGIINSSLLDSYKAAIISEDAFETCLDLDPENTKVMKLLADIYYRNESFKKASRLIEEKIIKEDKSPGSPDLALLNLCYIRGNLQEQGIAFLNLTMNKYPDNQFIKLQLSILYSNLNQEKKAVKLLNSVASSSKSNKQQKDYAKKLLLINRNIN